MKGAFKTIVGGELRYHLRDPLTVLLLVVVPLVVYPAMLFAFAKVGQVQADKVKAQVLRVAGPPQMIQWIQEGDHLEVIDGELKTKGKLEKGDVLAKIQPLDEAGFEIRYRGDVEKSSRAMKRAKAVLERWQADELGQRFVSLGLDVAPDEVVEIKATDLSPPAARSGALLGRLIPVILVFLLSSGGLHTALDVFTGEKDRGTLETLLTTRTSRRDILMGKFFVVLLFTVTSGFLALGSLWASVRLGWVPLPEGLVGENVSLDLKLSTVAILMAFALPLSLQLAAILTALAAWAPDFRAGQALALPVVLVPAGLAGIAAVPEVDLNVATALLPIGNIGLAARELLAGQLGAGMLGLVMAATAGHAALALWAAVKMLTREDLILGHRGAADRRARGDFTIEAVGLFFLAVLLMWFLGQLAQARDMVWGMVFTQVLLMAAPGIAVVFYLGQPVAKTLQARLPKAQDALLAVAIGLTAPGLGMTIGTLQKAVLPVSEAFTKEMVEALSLDAPLWVTLVVFAVLPGICEEILFRGAIQGLLGRLKPVARILVVGLFFGLIHMSINRILPTGVTGLILATVAWRSRSLLVPIIIHVLHNAFLMCAAEGVFPFPDPGEDLTIPLIMGVAALALIPLVGRGRGKAGAG